MPQMAPYNWLLLNLLFILMFMLYYIFLHFTNLNNNINFKKKNNLNSFKFKW